MYAAVERYAGSVAGERRANDFNSGSNVVHLPVIKSRYFPPVPDAAPDDAEAARLQAELAVAQARLDAVRDRVEGLRAASRRRLDGEVERIRVLLAEMEREHERDLNEIRRGSTAAGSTPIERDEGMSA